MTLEEQYEKEQKAIAEEEAENSMGRIVIYLRHPDGREREIASEKIKKIDGQSIDKSINDAIEMVTLGLMTALRRKLRIMVVREACKNCIKEHWYSCLDGHTEKWVKKILGDEELPHVGGAARCWYYQCQG